MPRIAVLAAFAALTWFASGCGAGVRLGVARSVTVAPPAEPSSPPAGPDRRSGDEPFPRRTFDGDAYLRKVSRVQGMAPDDARRWLHQLGHTGEIAVVVLYQYDAACGQNTVCTYSPARHAEDDITLWINRKTAIAVPSP